MERWPLRTTGPNPAWAPFAGVRPSIELLVGSWAVGLGGWARFDLIQLEPAPYFDVSAPPGVLVGGVFAGGTEMNRLSLGMDLYVGYRFQ